MKKAAAVFLILDLLLGMMILTGFRDRQAAWVLARTALQPELEQEPVKKKIALTFDDGPHPYCTEKLLDGLKERSVHATFFLTGQNAQTYPELVKRMAQEGHLIGNHTYSHMQLTEGNESMFKQELKKTSEVIREITGEDIVYVRPPYGSWNREFEKELNMFPVLWSIDPMDWCSSNAACIVRSVCAKAGENDIILMHDQYKTTVTAALEIVDELQKQGFVFVTVDEILFD